jgi:hypothetical protein
MKVFEKFKYVQFFEKANKAFHQEMRQKKKKLSRFKHHTSINFSNY